MKRIVCISVLSAAALLSSCAGFLEEAPTTQLSESSVYATPESAEANLAGCYDAFINSQNSYMGRWQEYDMPAAGLVHWKNNRTTPLWLGCLTLSQYANSNYTTAPYAVFYSCINRCNKLIAAMESSSLDENFCREVIAEARFYRAVQYFTLVRVWGDVPLNIVSPSSYSEVNVPRTAYYKVYAQILEDFSYAEQYMRDPARQLEASGEASRPNKWAATAFKASVYLTIGSLLSSPDDNFWDSSKDDALIAAGKDPRTPDFSACGINSERDAMKLAYDTAVNVIEKGPYRLVEHYADLFKWTNPEDFVLPERIFTLVSNNGVMKNSMLAIYTLPQHIENVTNTNSNWGRIRPERFFFQKWCSTYNGVKGTGSNNSSIYVDCADPRLSASMWYGSYYDGVDKKTVSVYPSNSKIFIGGGDTGVRPYFKKYYDPEYDVTNGNADYYFMRFAEVYLIAAEAAASLSQAVGDEYWNKAVDNVNVILTRARHTESGEAAEPQNWTYDRFASKEDLIMGIIWERMFELNGEGHDIFDTHRRGAKFLRDMIAVPKNRFLHSPTEAMLFTYAYPFTYSLPEYKDVGLYVNGSDTYGDTSGVGYPEDIQELRKSLLFAFPITESEFNTAVTEEDVNDFFWKN